jgi:ABC-type Mn2+/Zn2+ transport system permease subunit
LSYFTDTFSDIIAIQVYLRSDVCAVWGVIVHRAIASIANAINHRDIAAVAIANAVAGGVLAHFVAHRLVAAIITRGLQPSARV